MCDLCVTGVTHAAVRGPAAPAGPRPAATTRIPRARRPAGTVEPMERRRIDALLADRGLARSRTSAAAAVRSGRVRVGRDGPRPTKPGALVPEDAELLVEGPPRFVSRGGIKLEHALDAL